MFLIVFDLLFQTQEKSRRPISKKGRNALVNLICRSSEIGHRSTSVILTIEQFYRGGGASF